MVQNVQEKATGAAVCGDCLNIFMLLHSTGSKHREYAMSIIIACFEIV
jgi:hypothetical protein